MESAFDIGAILKRVDTIGRLDAVGDIFSEIGNDKKRPGKRSVSAWMRIERNHNDGDVWRRRSSPPPATTDIDHHQTSNTSNMLRVSNRVVKDPILNIDYTVKNIKSTELPVIGTYIDASIIPGFFYTVRKLNTGETLFNGKPRQLLSIGIGYGKRITFSCDRIYNAENPNIFWSDSCADGFAFSLSIIRSVGEFVAYNDASNRPVGTATVTDITVKPAQEVHQSVTDGAVTKEVKASIKCLFKFEPISQHGFLNIRSDFSTDDDVLLEGVCHLVKPKSTKTAVLKRIENVNIPSIGKCTLIPDHASKL
ncbi:uncharacterized protein LOC141914902 [Tubulanus polymorphus]|uniref:uncharacterized protein LOC141914902 n=1 Tax=Tubulanus polymorphus TaxID=672921 RepID=UPI003DA3DAA4